MQQGINLQYAYSTDGKKWQNIGDVLDGSFLSPWDRDVRIALTAQGNGTGYFDWFTIMKQ